MAPQRIKVNPLFLGPSKPFIDSLSKWYIALECLFGLNRLPVILLEQSYCFSITTVANAYCLFLYVGVFYSTYVPQKLLNFSFFTWSSLCIEYIFCGSFSFITWKKISLYYQEINKFDTEIGCMPKTTGISSWNLIITTVSTVIFIIFHGYLSIYSWPLPVSTTLPLCIVTGIHCLEIFYYGHLLSLLVARLSLINYYMETSLPMKLLAKRPDIEELFMFKTKNKENNDMKKLMDLYHILIKSYDLLMESIKWQLLVIIITTFIRVLAFCYGNVYNMFFGQVDLVSTAKVIAMVMSVLLPFFSPCVCADRVHSEVRRLRELIASRLYENTLDKTGRSNARALLGLTETRDLSFSLLRMLKIDVSFPFKFIGLTVTYLIILVQFGKVIHPNGNT